MTYIEIFLVDYTSETDNFDFRRELIEVGSINPDKIVSDYILQNYSHINEQYISHSTSWRYDDETKDLLLTYVVFSDYFNFSATGSIHLETISLAHGTWTSPRPNSITLDQVLSHGLRHVAFLLKSNSAPNWLKYASLEKFMTIKSNLAGKINI